MAFDKAVDSTVLETGLTTIADAIRAKGGTDAPLDFPQGMADAVAAIEGGGGGTSFTDFIEGKTAEARSDTAKEIASFTLAGMSFVKSLYFPEVIVVHSEACKENRGVESIYFPKVKTLEPLAFFNCPKLSKVDFPAVESIARYSFMTCSSLKTAIFRFNGIVSMGDKNAFVNTPIAAGTGYIYVPKALVEQYKTATNWVTYAAQIRAIEDYPDIVGGLLT